jgi:release factor glutamine methyltransferase
MEYLLDGLSLEIPEDVYQPAEDSRMLASGAKSLRGRILEVGCGSGMASLSCARASPANSVLGVDINPSAVRCAMANALRNHISNASFEVSDLFGGVKGAFDAILFNPPYLPTSDSERLPGLLNEAFDGGPDGRRVLDRFLLGFDRHLRPGGRLLLVQSSLNGDDKTIRALGALGYSTSIAATESFFFERLFLLESAKP